jgi:hypothetical protein
VRRRSPNKHGVYSIRPMLANSLLAVKPSVG